MKNIFIEGLQGSGKTTLMLSLYKKLVGYHLFLEGDISPVDLAWCSYMTEEEYQRTLAKYSDLASEIEKHTVKEETHFIVEYTRILADRKEFYIYMEQYEIYNGRIPFNDFKDIILRRFKNFHSTGNLFECSFFQNIIEELLLFYCMNEEEVIRFYREMFAIMKQKQLILLYICSDDIEGNILKIKEERSNENGVGMWYPLMMNYFNHSPYGKKCEFVGLADMVAHFKIRMDLELKIIKEILGEYAIILPSKAYDIEDVLNKIKGN